MSVVIDGLLWSRIVLLILNLTSHVIKLDGDLSFGKSSTSFLEREISRLRRDCTGVATLLCYIVVVFAHFLSTLEFLI